METSTFDRIRAAAIDGRVHNIYYRQIQLERICKALVSNAQEIQNALREDCGYNLSEVAAEFHVTIATVKGLIRSLQPAQAHVEEYRIANGEDAPAQRSPYGIVYVEPTAHTLFYSVVAPFSAAIAAGNCVIVLLNNSLDTLSNLIRRLLSEALDPEIYAIASQPIDGASISNRVLHVNQESTEEDWPRANQLFSPCISKCLAVVDRSADVQLAARELVSARFSFRGRSPYAPDIVFVNEFTKKDFLQAVVSECVRIGSGVELSESSRKSNEQVQDQIDELRKGNGIRVILQEDKLAVVDLCSRLDRISTRKITSSVLVVQGMRSLDDAIDAIGRSSNTNLPYLAAYHFGNPETCKYLSQFVDSAVSFINHVPRELLIGPALPASHPLSLADRHSATFYTQPRPAFTKQSSESTALAAVLSSSLHVEASRFLADATKSLQPIQRDKGGGVGFFDQGFFTIASLIMVSAVTLSGSGAWWVWRHFRPV